MPLMTWRTGRKNVAYEICSQVLQWRNQGVTPAHAVHPDDCWTLQAGYVGAGWLFVLRRGRTTTSLSVPGHQSTFTCVHSTMDVLRLQGIHDHDYGQVFPSLEQITIGSRCPSRASAPMSRYYDCKDCHGTFILHERFRAFLADVKVCCWTSFARAVRSA